MSKGSIPKMTQNHYHRPSESQTSLFFSPNNNCVVTCWMLSAEPHVLCSFSLLCPTPRKLLNASVVLLTLTFKEPILKKRKSFSAMRIYNLFTYLLTPWSRVLLEKLTGSASSQEIPRIFGTRRFITVPTSARHLSLS